MYKSIMYLLIMPLVFWAFDSVSIKNIFKTNRIYQSRLLYLFLVIALSYLVVQFLYDFISF